jgi:O-acetylserine/cysteine efflux transporter
MPRRDILLALLVIFTWGIHFPVIKLGTNEVSGLILVTLRFVLTGLLFLPFCKSLTRSQFKNILIFSGLYYMGHLPILFVATSYLESATIALIMQSQVPMAIIFGWVLCGEKFGWRTLSGLVLAFVGLFFIFGSPDITSILGLVLTLLSAMFWALGSIQMRKIHDIDMPSMTAYSCLLAAPITATLSFFFDHNQVAQIAQANWIHLGFTLAYQVCLMSFMMYIWKQLLSRNPVQSVTAFSLLQPIVAVISAHFMLGEKLSGFAIFGGVLAMCGVGIIMLRNVQKHKQHLHDIA